MSEQYRCTECGHFVEIQDDATCDVCHVGKMEHLRYIKGGAGSHWEGCEEVHWDCKIAQLEAELARRDEKIAELEAMINPASFDKYLVEQLKDPDLAEQYAKAIVRDSSYKEFYDKANEYLTDTKSAIARRDEIIARLKEDGDRLIGLAKASTAWDTTSGRHVCQLCERKSYFDSDNRKVRIDHAPDCPITLHRALMKELEDK